MATFPPKAQKSLGLIEPVWVLVYIAIVGTLMASGFRFNARYISFSRESRNQSHAYVSASVDTHLSFSSDERYWKTNCSRGWAKDSTCDVIMLKAQSCEFGSNSIYCSDYHEYLRQPQGKIE